MGYVKSRYVFSTALVDEMRAWLTDIGYERVERADDDAVCDAVRRECIGGIPAFIRATGLYS